ncbi:MAG: phosphoribosylamine--glycine ligase, partial [Elusimicrobiota bacterium]
MKVLVIGNGGREHALALRLHNSPSIKEIHSTPYNTGILSFGKCVDIPSADFNSIFEYVRKNSIDLVVVGPEEPLSNGIVDFFREKNVPVFGPTKAAARIETSKGFAKELMAKYNIPTASFKRFTNFEDAKKYIENVEHDIVIKADGLAAGKGVILPETKSQSLEAAWDMLTGKLFGKAGSSIVIEERLTGPEISVFAITDGNVVKMLPPAQDHKRIFDNDQGPNTGGMGSYAPVPFVTSNLIKTIEDKIIHPAVKGMASEGIPYTGLLYAGLMITVNGPKVIEFNCRFGDPETQVVLPLIQGDFGEILMASSTGSLDKITVSSNSRSALCVVLASKGYPASSQKGITINGLEKYRKIKDVIIYHAGTK